MRLQRAGKAIATTHRADLAGLSEQRTWPPRFRNRALGQMKTRVRQAASARCSLPWRVPLAIPCRSRRRSRGYRSQTISASSGRSSRPVPRPCAAARPGRPRRRRPRRNATRDRAGSAPRPYASGRTDGIDLGQQIDAIAVLLDHAEQSRRPGPRSASGGCTPLAVLRASCRVPLLDTIPGGVYRAASADARQRRDETRQFPRTSPRRDAHATAARPVARPCRARRTRRSGREAAAGRTDPVCGMTVDPATSQHRFEHGGKTFHFCCAGLPRRNSPPTRPLPGSPTRTPAPHAVAGRDLHLPDAPRDPPADPAACPICGMALEPLAPTAEAAAEPRARRHDAAVLDRPRADRAGGGAGDGRPCAAARPASALVPPRCRTGSSSCSPRRSCCGPAGRSSSAAGLGRQPQPQHVHPDRARAPAPPTSTASSPPSPRLFPAGFRATDGTVAVYFEAAAVITVLVLLGQVLELRAREQTGGAIRALLDLAPKTARRLSDDGDGRGDPARPGARPATACASGPGDGVPVDGVVLEGRSASTSRWSPASRCRSPSSPAKADRRHGERHRRAGDARRARSAPTPCWRASSPWWPRRSAVARADPAPGRHRRRLVRARR